MFIVENILVSDDLLDAPFSCNLGQCLGACCTHEGGEGAPLDKEECDRIDAVLAEVWKDLPERAQKIIEKEGAWEEIRPGEFATRCIDNRDCVLVTYDGPVAKCAIQNAYFEGRVDWSKPISCHLYPIRIKKIGDQEMINYDQSSLCISGRRSGRRTNVQLFDYLKTPLIRKYGEAWYVKFREACINRKDV